MCVPFDAVEPTTTGPLRRGTERNERRVLAHNKEKAANKNSQPTGPHLCIFDDKASTAAFVSIDILARASDK